MIARLAILAALWSPLVVSACCSPTVIRRPVTVTAPPCLTRPAPLPPEGATIGGQRWAAYYVELSAWVVEAESACLPRDDGDPRINSAPADTPLIVGPYAD